MEKLAERVKFLNVNSHRLLLRFNFCHS